MNWDSIGSLSASGYSAVEYVTFPRPDPNTPLNITCPDSYTCYHAKIYCPLNADCRVNCVGYHACVGATFYFSPSPTARFDLHCDDSQDACGESQKRAINTTTTQTPISTSSTSSTTSTSTQSSTSTASTSALSTGFQTTAVSSESSNMAKVEKQIQILSVAVIVLSILMFCVLLIGLGYCMTNGRMKKRTKGAYVEFSKDESA
eukprot:CAMPEP_0197044134 /NCGR_PEP_ID=MMETSP1384-20130603/20251_1 /TAXON_ID=29189 /ORGANISM="Ammonia sp." /LENGTH=203 /DNA_ID=CAMNT_0042475533 /DNA_START=275 /DNA_END=886 /DNA_ORIENTATION=-